MAITFSFLKREILVTEILCGSLIGLIGWKFYTGKKIKHYDFGKNSTYDHSQYDSFCNYVRASQDGQNVYSGWYKTL